MISVDSFLESAKSPMDAYNSLQVAHMRIHLAGGGTIETWCIEHAPGFRTQFEWITKLSTSEMAQRAARKANGEE